MVFFCANCHDITERKWGKAKKVTEYKKYMGRFKKKRDKDNRKIILNLEKETEELNLKYSQIKQFIERFKIFDKNMKEIDYKNNLACRRINEKELSEKKRIRKIKETEERKIREKYSKRISNLKSNKEIKKLRRRRDKKIEGDKKRFNKLIEKIEKKYGHNWKKQRKAFDSKINILKNIFLKRLKITSENLNFKNKKYIISFF